MISSTWNAISEGVKNVLNAIKNAVQNVWNALPTPVRNAMNSIKDTVQNVWNKVKSGILAEWIRSATASKSAGTALSLQS